MKAKAPQQAERELIPDQVHIGVCYSVVDLGSSYSQKYKNDIHRIHIGWEIPDLRIAYEKDGEELEGPRVVSQRYILSLGKKASLRRDLESWRGKPFTQEDLDSGFELKNLLGKACQIQIIHDTNPKTGITYANIKSIMALPRALAKDAPKNEKEQYFSFDDPNTIEVFDELPEFLQEQIKEATEWAEFSNPEAREESDIDDITF